MRLYRAVWVTVALPVGVAGAYLTTARQPVPVLAGGAVGAVLLIVVLHVRHPDWSWTQIPPGVTRAVVLLGAGWSSLGLAMLFGRFGGLVASVLIITSPPVLSWLAAMARPSRGRVPAPLETYPGVDQERLPTRPEMARLEANLLSDLNLCRAWRSSYLELQRLQLAHRVSAQLALVMARQSYLDELERRDPAGFRRWLATDPRPAGDPARFLTPPPPPPFPLPTDGPQP